MTAVVTMTTGSHSLDILETLRIEKFRVYNTVDYLKSKILGYGYALIVSIATLSRISISNTISIIDRNIFLFYRTKKCLSHKLLSFVYENAKLF